MLKFEILNNNSMDSQGVQTLLKMNKEIIQLLSMGDSPQAQKHVSHKIGLLSLYKL